jgi:hypothetical protein
MINFIKACINKEMRQFVACAKQETIYTIVTLLSYLELLMNPFRQKRLYVAIAFVLSQSALAADVLNEVMVIDTAEATFSATSVSKESIATGKATTAVMVKYFRKEFKLLSLKFPYALQGFGNLAPS